MHSFFDALCNNSTAHRKQSEWRDCNKASITKNINSRVASNAKEAEFCAVCLLFYNSDDRYVSTNERKKCKCIGLVMHFKCIYLKKICLQSNVQMQNALHYITDERAFFYLVARVLGFMLNPFFLIPIVHSYNTFSVLVIMYVQAQRKRETKEIVDFVHHFVSIELFGFGTAASQWNANVRSNSGTLFGKPNDRLKCVRVCMAAWWNTNTL